MTLFFRLDGQTMASSAANAARTASVPVAATSLRPDLPETPPSPWLMLADTGAIRILDLDHEADREKFVHLVRDIPLYRIALELSIDRILTDAARDDARMKCVKQAFLPDDPPEAVVDPIAQKYGFSGTLNHPIIASRTERQLIDLHLKLFAALPAHASHTAHIESMLGGYPERFFEKCDGLIWKARGWVRLDHLIYDAERLDHDPDVTFESYVTRGRAGAEALAVSDPAPLLAAWVQAERVQQELCRDIDLALRLPDIRRLPKWMRADVFRILEREAMKQVFAEGLASRYGDWPELRRCKILAEPISANAKGDVSPLIQQLLNQTLSADARYAGSAEAFALQAERRFEEAKRLLA